MKSTRILTLVAYALVAAVGAFLWATFSITRGREISVSGFNLMFSLPAVAVVLVILALPIYRYRKELGKRLETKSAGQNQPAIAGLDGTRVKRVDPFYAVRVLILAKATAIAGALFVGWHFGTVLVQLGLPVISAGVWFNLATLLGAVAAIGVAIWVENICKIPDDPDETANGKVQLGGAADAALNKNGLNKSGLNKLQDGDR